MNYSDFQTAITIRAAQAQTPYTSLPTDFSNSIARFIDYAEGRIYRDCIFLAQRTQNGTLSFTSGNRELSIASITPALLVLEGVAIITPASTAPASGTRIQCQPASLDFIDMIWPVEATTAAPSAVDVPYWAMKDEDTIVVAPTPNGAYRCELTGIFRPTALSASNTTTYLATTYGELMLAAAMIDVCAYLRDFGQMADDPKIAMSYEAEYQQLLPGVKLEEDRRRGAGVGWSAFAPTPVAEPPRP